MADQPKKKPDIKDVDLATGIDRIPEWWGRHGNKVLIAITLCAVAYAFYTFKRNSAESAKANAESDLATARDLINQVRSPRLTGIFFVNPESYSTLRRQVYTQGTAVLGDLLTRSDDEGFIAQGLLLRGDLNYSVSLLPNPPAAATRPALNLDQSNSQLVTAASESYQAVLQKFPSRPRETAAARFGLAAIAENAGDFEAAKKYYTAIADDRTTLTTYQEFARVRLKVLPQLAKPMVFRAATQPAPMPFLPGTMPAVPTAAPTGLSLPVAPVAPSLPDASGPTPKP